MYTFKKFKADAYIHIEAKHIRKVFKLRWQCSELRCYKYEKGTHYRKIKTKIMIAIALDIVIILLMLVK